MVYVDDYRAPYRRMKMSHLTADTEAELEEVAARLGLKPEWKQYSNLIHYDVCEAKRVEALSNGARACTPRELVKVMMNNTEMNQRAKRKAKLEEAKKRIEHESNG